MSESSDTEKLLELLTEIQVKLKAPALNGGFDTLMYKVDKIEQTQEKILDRISTLSETIYDPDLGLFARIKATEILNANALLDVEKELVESRTIQEAERVSLTELTASVGRGRDQIYSLEKSVEHIARWKGFVTSGAQWFAVTLATTSLGVAVKFSYDYFLKK